MTAAEKTSVCRKRARVRRFEDKMLRVVEHFLLCPRKRAPEHKNHRPVNIIYYFYGRVGKFLPAYVFVGGGFICPHRENRI